MLRLQRRRRPTRPTPPDDTPHPNPDREARHHELVADLATASPLPLSISWPFHFDRPSARMRLLGGFPAHAAKYNEEHRV